MYVVLVHKEEGTPLNTRIHDIRAVRGCNIEFTITDTHSNLGLLQVHATHINMSVVRRSTHITLEPEALDDDKPHPPPRSLFTRLLVALGLRAASRPPQDVLVTVKSVAYAGWPSTLRIFHSDELLAVGDTLRMHRCPTDPIEEATIHRVRPLEDGWTEFAAFAHDRGATIYLLQAIDPPRLPSHTTIISKLLRIKYKLSRLLTFDMLAPIFTRSRT